MMTVQINNIAEFASRCRWIVCRAVDGAVWFYDAWADAKKDKAFAQAQEVEGFVVENTAWMEV